MLRPSQCQFSTCCIAKPQKQLVDYQDRYSIPTTRYIGPDTTFSLRKESHKKWYGHIIFWVLELECYHGGKTEFYKGEGVGRNNTYFNN